jgi:hypothetical protein
LAASTRLRWASDGEQQLLADCSSSVIILPSKKRLAKIASRILESASRFDVEGVQRIRDGVPEGSRHCTTCYRFIFPSAINDHAGSASGPKCHLKCLSEADQRKQILGAALIMASDTGNLVGHLPQSSQNSLHCFSPSGSLIHLGSPSHGGFQDQADNNQVTNVAAESPIDDFDILELENENFKLQLDLQAQDSEEQKRIRELKAEN